MSAAAPPMTPEQQAIIDATLAEISPYLNGFMITYCCLVAVLAWDTLINLKNEYNKIWSQPPSLVSVAYFFCRWGTIAVYGTFTYYYTHAFADEKDCDPAYLMGPIFSVFGIMGTQGILLLRTYALWSRARWILFVLIPLYIASFTTQFVVAKINLRPFPRLPGVPAPCLPNGDAVLSAYFVAPMSFDIVTTALTLYRFFVLKRQGATLKSGTVIYEFFQGGAIYFILISAVNLLNVLLYTAAPTLLKVQGSAAAVILSSIFGARLVLGLRAEESHSMATIGTKSVFRSTYNQTSSNGYGSAYKGASNIPLPPLGSAPSNGSNQDLEKDPADFSRPHTGVHVQVEKTFIRDDSTF